ncbi:hypothetical protein Tco_0481278 [Tanacetum coccineum]
MGDENPICTLGDYSKPSHEGYRNTIELPVGNNVVPLRSDTIRLVQNGSSFYGLRSEDQNQHLKDFLKLVDLLDLDARSITTWEDLTTRFLAQLFPPERTAKLLPHHGIDLWLQVKIFYDRIDHTLKRTVDYASGGRLRKLSEEKAWATIEELARNEDEGWNDLVAPGEGSLDSENPDIEQLLGVMECKVDTLMKKAISLMGRSEIIFGMTSNIVYQLPSEPYRQEEFENLVMNFTLDQKEKVKQLEEYIDLIGSDFMQLSLEVVGKLKKEIRMEKNRVKKIEKITSPPLVRESTFGFKPGTRNNRNIKSRHDAENPYPYSTPQVLPSFEEHTPPVTYPEEVEETLGIPMEVEPLDEPQPEDLGLNTCNHDITLSYKKIPSVDEPEPQLLQNSSSLDVILGDKRGTDLPINPCISGSFRKKVVDPLTINTPPSPHVAYYHPGLDNPKKHYGFKPGLLGQSGSLGVDFLNMEMIEND